MKKHLISLLTFLLLGFLSALSVYAQAPEKFTYQAEARDSHGTVIRNANLEVKITILAGSLDGSIVWDGTHEINTDKYGLFTLVIGEGTGGSYNFSDIDWANNSHYLNVKVTDRQGNWVNMGTFQLLSVPYALHAKTAANLDVIPGGNIGIGVPDPQEALDVLGNVHVSGGFIAGSTTEYNDGSITLSDGTHLDIDYGTLFIDNTNNRVGFGTTSPSEKLDVVGIVKATEFVGDGSGLTGIITTETDPVFSNLFSITSPVDNQMLRYNSSISKWENVDAASAEGWGLSGNAGTDPANNFLGTIDDNPIVFRVNNSERMRLNSNGNLAFNGTGNSVFIGDGAGVNDDLTSNQNVFIGFEAGNSNSTGSGNIATGYQALASNTTGSGNTATGYDALYCNTTGSGNTASGGQALYSNTTGFENIASGARALYFNTTGTENTATGYEALYSNITGELNTANGTRALYFNTTGHDNTATGRRALGQNTTASGNTAFGSLGLVRNTTGSGNTATGYQALSRNIDGNFNTATGYGALSDNTTGNYNLALGFQAGENIITGSKNIIIGSNCDAPSPTGNDQLNIGNTIYGNLSSGNVGIGTTEPSEKLEVDGSVKATAFIGDGSGLIGIAGGVTTYSIGDFAQGGIVFWVDETGQHGLVCAKEGQDGGLGILWYNGSYTDTEAHGDGVYAGEMNTMLIIANQGHDSYNYAAGVCGNLTVLEGGETYGDWYLPSKKELNLMFQNKTTIEATAMANGGSTFANVYYWSSTETSSNIAWLQGFHFGTQDIGDKGTPYRVRAIRAF